VTKGGRVIERNFIGHFETVQYLEDCGVLAKVLTGDLCSHFRQYAGHIFFPWCRPLEQLDSNVEICSFCHLNADRVLRERLIVVGNFMGGKCAKTHDLSIFFESNKIPFVQIDPFNAHLKSYAERFVLKHAIPVEPVRLPRIFIWNKEVTIKKIHEYAAKGLLLAILRGQRCQACLQKKAACVCLQESENPRIEEAKNQSTLNLFADRSSLFVVPEENELECNSTAKKLEES